MTDYSTLTLIEIDDAITVHQGVLAALRQQVAEHEDALDRACEARANRHPAVRIRDAVRAAYRDSMRDIPAAACVIALCTLGALVIEGRFGLLAASTRVGVADVWRASQALIVAVLGL